MTARSAMALVREDDPKLVRELVTPEGIPVRFTLARASERAGALLIDLLLMVTALALLTSAVRIAVRGEPEGTWLTAVTVVLGFVLSQGYFAAFELRWHGATPGKRAFGLRVIDARGGQLELGAVLARNLIRELELWMPLRFLLARELLWPDAPGWAGVAAGAWTVALLALPLLNRDRLRVGDMIAGTLVVVRPRLVLPPELADEPATAYAFSDAQLSIYGIYELQVLEDVLRRDPGAGGDRAGALRTVSEAVRKKLDYGPVSDDERFLRELYAAQRARLEHGLLLGKRRADKLAADDR